MSTPVSFKRLDVTVSLGRADSGVCAVKYRVRTLFDLVELEALGRQVVEVEVVSGVGAQRLDRHLRSMGDIFVIGHLPRPTLSWRRFVQEDGSTGPTAGSDDPASGRTAASPER